MQTLLYSFTYSVIEFDWALQKMSGHATTGDSYLPATDTIYFAIHEDNRKCNLVQKFYYVILGLFVRRF